MLLPRKKVVTMFRIKNARNTIIKPTIAATIVFRALSTAVLSPPEKIHLIPPKIRKAKAITIAIIKKKVTRFPTTSPKLPDVILQRPAKSPVGQVSIVSAKTIEGLRR